MILANETGKLRIKERREMCGLKRAYLARQIGVSTETLARWERGEREPLASDVARIANVLNCAMQDIMPKQNPLLPSRRRGKSQSRATAEGRVVPEVGF